MTDLSGHYLGRYYLAERLGEGGMAVVYKAYDTRLERDVAVKIIRSAAFPPEEFDQVLKRFEREAKSLAKLSHPSIVKVHDFGEHEGSPYLVMEYLPGGTLKKYLGKPLPWQDAVHLVLPVARGVAYAHKRGILHRDIKPANVLITDDGEPMLSDFGIAKLFEGEQTTALTGSGMAIGTPEYMAPEQWTGVTSPLSDQYSLGIVFYELLTGRKPYEADTPAAILIKQATEPLPSPRKFIPDLPELLEYILIKSLAKEPGDRYPNLNDFVHELEELHASMLTVIPSPPSTVVEKTYKLPIQEPVISLPAETFLSDDGETIKVVDVPETHVIMESDGTKISTAQRINPLVWKRIGILLGAIGIVVIGVLWFTSREAVEVPITTATSSLTVTKDKTPSPVATVTATPLPIAIMDASGIPMRLIPAGEFTMGMNTEDALNMCQIMFSDCTSEQFVDEAPSHTVFLDMYYMDQFEVTNANYKACVDASVCEPPTSIASGMGNNIRPKYYGEAGYDNYPVVNIKWGMAQAYCGWRGARLPTEAEWEKAARGMDGRIFPWGSTMVDSTFANYAHAFGDTMAVGQYENGQSPYGIYDLAGNVEEWVDDWYAAYPGQDPNAAKNFGSSYRVVRGGNWNSNEIGISAVSRDWRDPNLDSSRTGFRCVSAVTPMISGSVTTQTTTPEPEVETLLTQFVDEKGIEMMLVPAGEFTMGDNDGNDDEKPAHTVYLESFFIDKYEVTNALYKTCVEEEVCKQPTSIRSWTRLNYFGNPEFADYLVIYVNWNMAESFCEWRHAKLPTEAQWEKAAQSRSI